MTSLPRLAVQRPVATSMLLLGAVLLGVVSLFRLDIALLPEVRGERLSVWIAYPEAGVDEIEESVARPVEEALASVRGVRSLRSRVVSGGVSLELRLQRGQDPELVALAVRERLEATRWSLPESVERPLLWDEGAGRPMLVLALGADDLEAAGNWAEHVLEPRLEQVEGVARAQVVGAPEREIQVVPDAARMAVHGIDARQLELALQEANRPASGGILQRRGVRYTVQIDSELRSARDVASVVIVNGARPIRVEDVATVTNAIAPAEGWNSLDGNPAVGILVYPEASANLIETARAARAVAETLQAQEPSVAITVLEDASPFVAQAISGVWSSLATGAIFAFLVLRFFLRDLRSPLILLTALPMSILPCFAMLELAGVSLNLMSLGGLALGVGMLVDNGILALENTHRLRMLGASPERAAAEGTEQIVLPILASTLTTVAVFVPLGFIPGPVGAWLFDQSIAITSSLLMSALIALTWVPMLAARRRSFSVGQAPLPLFGAYHRSLVWTLRHPGLFLTGTALALVLSGVVLRDRPREILPDAAIPSLALDLALPAGTDVSGTSSAADSLAAWLRSRPEVEHVFVSVGTAGELDPGERGRGSARGTVQARLDPREARARAPLAAALLGEFSDHPDWRIEIRPAHDALALLRPGEEATLTCEITGPDPARAQELAERIGSRAHRALDGRGLPVRVWRDDLEPQLRLDLDAERAWRLGLDEASLLREVAARSSGFEVSRLRSFDDEVPLMVRPAPHASGAASLVAGGRSLPQRHLFAQRTSLVPADRTRIEQARVAGLSWDGSLRDARRVHAALETAIDQIAWPTGYSARLGGGWLEMRETLRAVGLALLLSLGIVFLVLAAQFESVRLPFAILVSIPLAAIGVAAALLVAGESLNALSAVGCVVLVGVVVNDAILKVDLLNQLDRAGVGRLRAILITSRARYRPILMTTGTTVLALVPMYFGAGAEFRAPLATTLIGGLTSATLLTLYVVPLLYQTLAGRRRVRERAPVAIAPSLAEEMS